MVRRLALVLTFVLAAIGPACGKAATRRAPRAPGAGVSATPIATPSPAASATPIPPVAIVPRPAELTTVEETFTIDERTTIVVDGSDPTLGRIAREISSWLAVVNRTGPFVLSTSAGVQTDTANASRIVVALDRSTPATGPSDGAADDSYELSVRSTGVRLSARTPAGLFYAAQSFRQLLPVWLEYEAARPRPIVVPAVEIRDRPRFSWRGAMLDVSRHFFGVEDVKRYVDLLALHKINRLHLHLSDDQGFRIEIKSWPNLTAYGALTEVGGTRGGFYTQADYAEIVRHAAERFVTIVPEIDVPGHTNAALASYPELNCDNQAPPLYTDIRVGFSALCVTKDVTYRFLDDVIREIAALTPGPWFHIGGDEVKTLSKEQYAAFIARVDAIVARYGKKTIGWDEVAEAGLERLPIVQHWRPNAALAAAAAKGTTFIMSPANRAYLDMQYDRATPLGLSWAGRVEVRDSYDWDPATVAAGVAEAAVLGVEAPLWSETVTSMSDLELLAFPRLAAIAEVGWTPQSQRNWDDFSSRLSHLGRRWQALGVNFHRSPQVPWKP